MKTKKNVKMLMIMASFLCFAGCNDTKDLLGKPIVSAIEPDSGTENGGTLVTITGENFDEDATVKIGGKICVMSSTQSETQILCITGEKLVSSDTSVDVVVTNPDADSDTLENGYTYKNE